MADAVEVYFLGRAQTEFSCDGAMPTPDVLFFVTPELTHILPVWVTPDEDRGGRPTDAEILAEIMRSAPNDSPWFAEIATNSRGQMTAGIYQSVLLHGGDAEDVEHSRERYIDVRPSTIEPLSRAGVIFEITLKPHVANQLIEVNPEWGSELKDKLAAVDEDGDPITLDLAWDSATEDFSTSSDPEAGFQQLWEGLGLSAELDDWLNKKDEDN
ncbi:MAG TPA: hypothetical protein H9867_00085 [Candidatus Corynebacterium gallistercoris]|uniref:Uncharacterized protein n=1 Tax=Candidatus Corynebacterium gallistercoris TaxID=2838530 RepID=A0A9D1RWL7_9CORY|nr:hypothetical protein [Candidatus Corynebacterium gallistercoris]